MNVLNSLICLFLVVNLFAAEVDQVTNRNVYALEDARLIISKRVNDYIKKAFNIINNDQEICDEEELYKKTRDIFGTLDERPDIYEYAYDNENELISTEGYTLIKYLATNLELKNSRYLVPFDESIYRSNSSFVFLNFLIFNLNPLASLLRFDNYLVGIDKFQHLFGSDSIKYFKDYLGLDNIENIPWESWKDTEYTIYGIETTGVYSYADLNANFNGMRFWNSFLLKKPDILGLIKEPHVSCINNQWVLIKDFDMRDFIDISFDEAINRSLYSLSFRGQTVIDNVLSYPDNSELLIPIRDGKYKGYESLSKHLLNTRGEVYFKKL